MAAINNEDEDIPRDAKIVKTMLKSMGVEDYDPRVVGQFLELWYRYVLDVLNDSLVYSEHAGKSAIDCQDVQLAIQAKVNSSFSQPPPREVLVEMARTINRIPLSKPAITPNGIPLPNQHNTLTNPNYQLGNGVNFVGQQKVQEMMEEEEDEDEEDMADTGPIPLQDCKPIQECRDAATTQASAPHRVSFPIGFKHPK